MTQTTTLIDPVELTQALIRCPSVTPVDAGALDHLSRVLEELGFQVTRLPFQEAGTERVENLYARLGNRAPNFCFAGHTDVVPVGNRDAWSVDPFAAEIRGDELIGRGASDMKGAIGAFVAAVAAFANRRGPDFGGSISLLITGDEEGPSINGTRKVLEWLVGKGERIDACVVGEPTNPAALGDMIKIGRRGSLQAKLTVHGTQGHTAYPHLADNPAERLTRVLNALIDRPLDHGTDHFQPSTLAVSSIDVGNPAGNVIPASARAAFNIRFNDLHTGESLTTWIQETLDRFEARADLDVRISGEAFLTPPGDLSTLLVAAVERVTGKTPELSTTGGTSDARFIKDVCPVAEFGLVGRTMHQIDERTAVGDIRTLARIYEAALDGFFAER